MVIGLAHLVLVSNNLFIFLSRAKKDIEFVIPPSFSSSTSNRPGSTPLNQKITISNNPHNDINKRTTSQAQQLKQQQQQLLQQQQQQDQKAVGTKGWDFLATVFSASVSLKDGTKARSKEAPALLITTTGSGGFLDIPTVKTA